MLSVVEGTKANGPRSEDLLDRLEVVVDEDGEQTDFDEAMVRFLLKYVGKKRQ